MEVKPGYKRTEAGVIPNEWTVKTFGELFAFSNGVNADKDCYGKGGRFINVLEPITYSHLHGPEIPGRVSLPQEVSAAYSVKRGDVLFNRTSETETELGLAATYLGTEPVVFGGFVIRGRPFDESLDPSYSGYALRSPAIRGQIIPMGQGGIRANIGQQNLSRVVAPVPPLPEQRAIAEALSDVDGLLGGLDRLIAKKRDLKQAAMQQLLTGQTRLPGFRENWTLSHLGDVADPRKQWSFTGGPFGSNLKSSDYTEDGVRIIQLQNIGDGEFLNDYAIFTSAAKADALISCNIYPGEIILSKMGDPVARACLIPANHERYLMCSDGIRLAVDPRRYDAGFIYFQINAPEFRAKAFNAGTGSTRRRIGLSELRNLELFTPTDKAEQTAIAEVLTDMDTELDALEQRRAKTRALKQAMMQELLTGRIRLV